ncbi:MAG TPA: hypothetical protein VGL62_01035 [Vicinamibacterales bacterium]
MVEIRIEGNCAVFEVEGVDRVLAFRSRLELPLEHLLGVDIDPDQARGWWHGLRLPGSNVPGVVIAGTFYSHGELVFWDVHDPARTVIVSLAHERYKKLIVEVADRPATLALLRAAVKRDG